MQTFVPYTEHARSASVLDRQRLGKQRVETLQIMKALTQGGGWANHPAVRMWGEHLHALYDYQYAMCKEWTFVRGYKDTCLDKTFALLPKPLQLTAAIGPSTAQPEWLGWDELHLSHRSNLLRKDPIHYGPLFPGDPDHLEYVWPM